MILLWGISADGPLASVRASLARLGAQVIFLDQQRILQTEMELTVDDTARGVLRLLDEEIELESIGSVYVRPYDTRRMAAVQAAGRESPVWMRALLCEGIISCWTEITSALVINRLSDMGSNGSKPYQASLIKSFGFDVPDTLLTTDREAATAFWERHGTVIYKSISGVRSIVSRLTADHGHRLDDVANCPTQFQQYIEGTDVRIHVVGDEIFGCEIDSPSDDYRYARTQGTGLKVKACSVPPALAVRCFGLAAHLNLLVAGIDLRRRRDGRWCCFEVNPSPAFTFYQEATGQPIGDAVARLLATKRA